MEDYAAKMAGKTDAELQLYLERRAEYREAAVLAAISELERRGHAVPGAAALRPELEAGAKQAAILAAAAAPPAWMRPAEPETAEDEAEVSENAPALYSPITVAVYTIMSFGVGGILMLMNLLRLRRYGGAALLMALVIAAVAALSWGSKYVEVIYVLMGINFVLALLFLYVLWPYFIGQQEYRPRNGFTPFLVVVLVQFLLGLLYYAVSGTPGAGAGL
jgi:hypothetical protein